jgi:uncharacterized membrane protein SpoIIM required for sporulation
MDVERFIRQREAQWRRLDGLLTHVETRGFRSLSAAGAEDLFNLYRLASSDLNLMQTRGGNPALLEYLEGLVARAYSAMAVPRRYRIFSAWWQILRHDFPAIMRREYAAFLLAAACLIFGATFGYLTMAMTGERYADVIIPPDHQSEQFRPAERVRMERQAGGTRMQGAGHAGVFSTFLFTHNIRVSILAFALGFTFGLGTVIVLFYNGVMLGALAAYYWLDGVLVFFVAWIGPHGSIELPCIFFAATAGLMLARAQMSRSRGSLRMQLRRMRPDLVAILVGTASLLVVAGVIEGTISQIHEPAISSGFKIMVAALLFTGLVVYLFVMPVRPSKRLAATEADASSPPNTD